MGELFQRLSVCPSQSPPATLSPELFLRPSATPSLSPPVPRSHTPSPSRFQLNNATQLPEKCATLSRGLLPARPAPCMLPSPMDMDMLPMLSQLLLLWSPMDMGQPTMPMELETPMFQCPELTNLTPLLPPLITTSTQTSPFSIPKLYLMISKASL